MYPHGRNPIHKNGYDGSPHKWSLIISGRIKYPTRRSEVGNEGRVACYKDALRMMDLTKAESPNDDNAWKTLDCTVYAPNAFHVRHWPCWTVIRRPEVECVWPIERFSAGGQYLGTGH